MQLILIRHSKSSWQFDLNDMNRPLSIRGIKDANLVFNQLFKDCNVKDFSILSSTSVRTRMTAAVFSEIFNVTKDEILFLEELYTFKLFDFEPIIKKYFHQNLIVFGHNNAIKDFVNKYSVKYFENIPTTGVVILKFVDKNIIPDSALVLNTIHPKDLK